MKDPNSPEQTPGLSRRGACKRLAAGALALSAGANALKASTDEAKSAELYKVRHGRIQQSVIHWCFNPMTPPELAGHAAALGMASVELVAPEFWPELTQRDWSAPLLPATASTR